MKHRPVWSKPGASFSDFSEDNRQCAQEHGIVMLDPSARRGPSGNRVGASA